LKNSIFVCRFNKRKVVHYALNAVYVSEEQETVSPDATVKPPVMLMSDAEAATAHWITIVAPEV
jgi:hypothetical protein